MYIGFNHKGTPMQANMTRVLERSQQRGNKPINKKRRRHFRQKQKCYLFMKMDASVDILKHNKHVNKQNRP